MSNFFENVFKLKENNTDMRKEILAGFTTFMTMAYILVVNPAILGTEGSMMDPGKVFTATAISAMIGTLVMAFLANLPFALAPGMGLNAFFVFSVVFGMGKSFQFALTAVFIEGLIFLVLSLFNVREAIIKSIPLNLKRAVSVGIGQFIAFIGLSKTGIVVQGEGIPLSLGNLGEPVAFLTLLGIIIAGLLLVFKVRGALFFSIIITTIIGIPMGVTQLPSDLSTLLSTPSAPYFFEFTWGEIFSSEMLIAVITFLFVDLFDTVGTLIGVATKAKMLDENGNVPRVKQALLADAIATTVGAALGTSTVTTYIESASGVSEGGRTGMTAFVAAILFGVSLIFAPLFIMIPVAATAPVLIVVGFFMMEPIAELDFSDFTEGIPAFLTIIMMPLSYAVSEGIIFGIVSYVLLKILSGKQKDLTPVAVILAVAFIVYKVSLILTATPH